MITPTKHLLAVMVCTSPTLALALGLGELRTHTSSDQPLEAYVDLYLSPTERKQAIATSLARDLFTDRDGTQSLLLAQVSSEVVHTTGSYSYIHLTSRAPLTASRFDFRLRGESKCRVLLDVKNTFDRGAPHDGRSRSAQRCREIQLSSY